MDITLPQNHAADVEIVTEYAWPEGYRPTVVDDFAKRGQTGEFVISSVKVREEPATTWRRVELYGRRVLKDGRVTGNRVLVNNVAVEAELYTQHLARRAR